MLKAHDYPAVYWGGATYFFQVNEALKQHHNTNLFEIIKLYQDQNRLNDRNIHELISSLDELSNSKIFSEYFTLYTTKSGREATQNTPLP